MVAGPFMTPVVFEVNQYTIKPNQRLNEAIDSIKKYNRNIIFIWVGGSASPEGPDRWNRQLGQYRAEALSKYIIQETGLENQKLRIHNLGEDWSTLEKIMEEQKGFPNRDRILTILSEEPNNETRKQKIQELDHGATWHKLITDVFPPLRNARMTLVSCYPKATPIAQEISPWNGTLATAEPPKAILTRPAAPIPTTYAARHSNWKIAVKTNLLFDVLLTANLGVEISPWTHWSLDIPVWYSPYNITSTRNIRLLAVQPEIRWWAKEAMNGHFVGLHTHVAGFNIALNDYARYQDPNHALWGMGLSYGYALSLGKSRHWGMEFNIGAGFAKYKYDAYRNWDNGPKFKSGSDCYWGITRAGVTLSYKWNLSRKDRKK